MPPESPLLIRPVTAGDAAEWLRMRQALWPQPSPETHRHEIDLFAPGLDAAVFVAARPDASLAGVAEVSLRSVVDGSDSSPVGYLEGWYVDPDVRRRGVGSALVRAAEAWARERGCRDFGSDVELDNDASQRAHEMLGFTEVSRVVTYIKVLVD